MPQAVVVAVVAGAAAVGAAAIGAVVTGVAVASYAAVFAMAFVTTLVTALVLPKLMDKPDINMGMQERKQMIKQPAHPRRTIYGTSKVSGVVLFIETANNDQDLYMVIGIASHEIDGVMRLYIGDTPVTFNGDPFTGFRTANNPSEYDGKVHIQVLPGTTTQTIPSDFSTNTSLNTTDKFKGIACICVKCNFDSDSFPNGIPMVSALVRGKKIYDYNRSATHYSNNPAYIFADYMQDTKFGLGAASSEIDNTHIIASGSVAHSWFTHKDDAANISDTYTVQSIASVNYYINDGTVVTLHDGDELTFGGTAYYVILGDGLTQYHPDDDSAVSSKYQAFRLATSQANWRNRSTSLPSSSSSITAERTKEIRYGCDGTLLSDASHETNVTNILTSCAGTFTYTGGVFRMSPASFANSSLSLTDDDIIGPIEIQTKISRKDRFNGVKGVFVGPENGWQEADFPAFVQSSFVTEDGLEIIKDVPLSMCIAGSQAQRIAKTVLFQGRNELQCNISTNLKGLRLVPNDRVDITSTRLGFTNQVFRVVAVNFGSDKNQLHCVLTLREDTSAAYDFDPSADAVTVDPTPDTNLPTFRSVSTPVISSFTNTGDLNNDGTFLSSAILSFAESTSGFISHSEIQLQAQLSGSFVTVDTQNVQQGVTTTRFGGLIVGRVYRCKVTCVSVLGVRSSAATSSNLTIAADTTAPSAYTGLTGTAIGEGALLTFTNPSETDFRGAEFVMRTGTGNPNSGGNSTINFSVAGSPGQVMNIARQNLTAGTQQRFWIRSTDFTGNASAFFPNDVNGIAVTPASGQLDVTQGGSSIVSNGTVSLGSFATVDTVTTSNISSLVGTGAVGTTFIANGAITTDKVNAGAINADKIATNTITANKIAVGAITADELGTGAVTTTKISDTAITTAKLAANAITADKITANTITGAKIAASTIAADRLVVTDLVLPSVGTTISGSSLGSFFENRMNNRNCGSIGTGAGFYFGFIRIQGGTGQVKSVQLAFIDDTSQFTFGSANTTHTTPTSVANSNSAVIETFTLSSQAGHIDRYTSDASKSQFAFGINYTGSNALTIVLSAQGDGNGVTLNSSKAVQYRAYKFSV